MKRFTAIVLAALLLVTAASAAKIESDADPQADFSSYATFAWGEGREAAEPDAQRWLTGLVRNALTSRGLRPVESDADLIVATYTLVERHTLEELADEATWDFWTGISDMRAGEVGGGTVVIDLIDRTTERIVWRGLASASVTDNRPKTRKKAEKALDQLFRLLPLESR